VILVTGGTGVMGGELVKRLCADGHAVRVLTLPGDANASRVKDWGAEVRFGNIANKADTQGLCDGVDTVYHLAAIIIAFDDSLYRTVNVEGTRNVIEAAQAAGVRHFIYVSSASVVYPMPTPYSLSKQECERIVRQSGLRYTIARPTLVYDRRGGQEFDMFLEYLKRFPVVPFIGSGRAIKRPVYAGDIVEGLSALHGKAAAYGKTYNFSGAERISMIDFARLCLALMGEGGKPVVHVPVWMCKILASLMDVVMKRPPLRWPVIAGVIQDADLDPSEAMKDLGYNPARLTVKLPQCFPRA